jgi:tetratricopeptide (TPR) repeat protein
MMNVCFADAMSRHLLDDLVEQRPEDLSIRYLLYDTMIMQGQGEYAVRDVQNWEELKSEDHKRRGLLIHTFLHAGYYERLIELLEQWQEENADNGYITYQLIDVYIRTRQYEKAQKELDQQEPTPSQLFKWLDLQIRLLVAQEECTTAMLRIDDFAREQDIQQIDAVKAEVLSTCGRWEEATALQKKILDADPCNADARLQYSLYLDKMGQTAEAIEQLDILQQAFPDDAGLMNNLGYSLVVAHEQKDRAARLLRESLRKEPESGPTLDSVGWLYYKMGDFARALEYLQQASAIMIQPDVEVYDHLGDAMYRLGRPTDARRYWSRALEQSKRESDRQQQASFQERLQHKLRQLTMGERVAVAALFEE